MVWVLAQHAQEWAQHSSRRGLRTFLLHATTPHPSLLPCPPGPALPRSEDDEDRAHRRIQRLRAFRHGAAQFVAALQAFLHSRTSGEPLGAGQYRLSRLLSPSHLYTPPPMGHSLLPHTPCSPCIAAEPSCPRLTSPLSSPAGEAWALLLAKLMVSSEEVAAAVVSRQPSGGWRAAGPGGAPGGRKMAAIAAASGQPGAHS